MNETLSRYTNPVHGYTSLLSLYIINAKIEDVGLTKVRKQEMVTKFPRYTQNPTY